MGGSGSSYFCGNSYQVRTEGTASKLFDEMLEENPNIPHVFSKTRFLILDEVDRVMGVGFKEELRFVFQCLPKICQTIILYNDDK